MFQSVLNSASLHSPLSHLLVLWFWMGQPLLWVKYFSFSFKNFLGEIMPPSPKIPQLTVSLDLQLGKSFLGFTQIPLAAV